MTRYISKPNPEKSSYDARRKSQRIAAYSTGLPLRSRLVQKGGDKPTINATQKPVIRNLKSDMSLPLLPESAPFSASQRAWLNGFFAGLLNIDGAGTAVSAAESVATIVAEDEEFSWHDPALALDERLELAQEKPYSRVLMAAMAQLDCGSCRYVCQTYAEAIASGADADISKCTPGGRETKN